MDNLIAKIKRGDTRALEYLFEQYSGALIGFVRSYVNDDMRAEDIVQDSFIAFWNNRAQLADESNIKSLLYTICRNRSLNLLRNEKKHGYQIELSGLIESNFKSLESVDFEFTDKSTIERQIEQLINGLPEKYREVFTMSRLEEKTYSQISSQLNITNKAVEKRMSKALAIFRKQFADDIFLIIFLFFLFTSRVFF